MKATQQVATNKRLRNQLAWRLLAADKAPVVIGLLQAHLFGGDRRRLPTSILTERIERDLELLRAEGWDLPQTAQGYLSQWLADGYVERTYEAGANEEVYELSSGTTQAIRFVEGLVGERTVATESRLALVIQQLVQLAERTETDPESRVQGLLRERGRLDAQIKAIRAGRLDPIPEERAMERVREIVALADELADDFHQVRDKFGLLNRQLREQILESDAARGGVLEELFAGVDVIAASEEGRTFKAFWRLLTDPRESAALEEALDRVLSRSFAKALGREERLFLSRMTKIMLERGGDVHDVLQHFARSLKQFVQSREFLEQRRVNELLKKAQRAALEIKDRLRPTDLVGHMLHLTSSRLTSLAQYRLYDPSIERVDSTIALADAPEISLEAVSDLLSHSDIDFRSLKEHVQTLLEKRQQVSVGEVLEVYPAEQGLGSVVGYLALAARHAVRTDHQEAVRWRGLVDGVERQAHIPRLYFVRGHSNELE